MTRDELGQLLAESLDLQLGQDGVRSRPWYRATVSDLLRHVDTYTASLNAELEQHRRMAKLTDIVADDTAKDLDALETRAETEPLRSCGPEGSADE